MAQPRQQLAAPAYLVAFALLVIPPFDALMQVVPFRMQDPRWRFGFFGLTSNAIMLPVCGLLVAYIIAEVFEHRRLQRVIGILSMVAAVTLVILSGLFALDALQVRKDVKPTAQLAFRVASLTAIAKAGLGILTFGAFGMATLRGPKAPKVVPQKRQSGLIVGSKAGVPAPAPALAPTGPSAEGSGAE